MRRSPLKPAAFKRQDSTGMLRVSSVDMTRARKEPKPPKGPRSRKCAVCRAPFQPRDAMRDKWCSVDCGAALALRLVAAKKAKAARADRAATRVALAKFKPIPKLKAELQTIFNKFIRLRDAALPCICCGKWPKTDGGLTGGQWDAAHWRSRGSADHLRYNEDNVHRALKDCNEYGHTDYRGGLAAKIGLARVEALECDQALVKWTREWLESKKTEYRIKIKELQA